MKPYRTFARLLLGVALGATACMDPGPTAVGRAPDQAAATTLEDAQHALLIAQRDAIRASQTATAIALAPTYQLLVASWKPNAKSSGTVNYLTCVPLQYAGGAEVIGPAGGTLRVGRHTLTVPPGALAKEYVFVGEQPMGDVIQVNFSPEGLKFAAPATLTLSYASCSFTPDAMFRAAYVDGSRKFLEWEPSKDDKVGKKVTASISHFSGYIIAY